MATDYLLHSLLSSGHEVSVVSGRIVISPRPGKFVPDDWLQPNIDQVITELSKLSLVPVFQYEDYSTGNYGRHKSGGLNLKLTNTQDGSPLYTIFNVDLKRAKNAGGHKAGSPLPKRHFRLRKGCDFLRFWNCLQLPLPRRPLSAMHDYMGKLSGILLTGQVHAIELERIVSSSIVPLSISANIIRSQLSPDIQPDIQRTIAGHSTDNARTKCTDKYVNKTYINQHDKIKVNAGANYCGNKVLRDAGEGEDLAKDKEWKQMNKELEDEWLADYCRRDDEILNFTNDFD